MVKPNPSINGTEQLAKGKRPGVSRLVLFVLAVAIFASGILGLMIAATKEYLSIHFFDEPLLSDTLPYVALLLPLMVTHKICVVVLRSVQNFRAFAYFNDLSVYLFAAMFVTFWPVQPQTNVFSIFVLSYFASVALILIRTQRTGLLSDTSRPKGVATSTVFSVSIPLLMVNSMSLIMSWTDTIMLGVVKSSIDVGLYNVALKLASLVGIVNIVLLSFLGPKISSEYGRGDFKKLADIIKFGMTCSLAGSLLFALCLVILGRFVLIAGFGTEFVASFGPMLVLTVLMISNGIGGLSTIYLNVSTHQKIVFLATAALSLVNIGLNYVLIPKYGIYGAAWATTASGLILNIAIAVFALRLFHQDQIRLCRT